MFPGTIVKAHDRLRTTCKTGDRHSNDFPDGVNNGHDSNVQVTARIWKELHYRQSVLIHL